MNILKKIGTVLMGIVLGIGIILLSTVIKLTDR